MAEHTFDSVAFRAQFPAFTSTTKYPDEQLSGYFTMATMYIYPKDWGGICGAQLQLALNLLTAHLTMLNQLILAGNTAGGLVTGATIDKVTVSLQQPANKDAWADWLNLTPYGKQLLALLRILSRGGGIVGGSPEGLAFRGPFGVVRGRAGFRR
jgi:hypothetical protein